MRDSSVTRWMGFIAIVIVIAIFLGFGPLGSGTPGENASGVSVAHWYNTHVGQSWASIYLVGLALASLAGLHHPAAFGAAPGGNG